LLVQPSGCTSFFSPHFKGNDMKRLPAIMRLGSVRNTTRGTYFGCHTPDNLAKAEEIPHSGVYYVLTDVAPPQKCPIG
jgi:hypothetical protein